MTDRELHLRERIDELTDQRDAALSALWESRARRKRTTNRLCEMRASRDLWRHRALIKSKGNAKAGTGSNLDGPGPVPAEGANHAS